MITKGHSPLLRYLPLPGCRRPFLGCSRCPPSSCSAWYPSRKSVGQMDLKQRSKLMRKPAAIYKERRGRMEGSNGWIEWGVWHYSTVRRRCTTLPLWRHCTILALCDSGCKQLTNQRSWRETNCHFAPSLYHFSSIQSFSSSYHFASSLYLFSFSNSTFFLTCFVALNKQQHSKLINSLVVC